MVHVYEAESTKGCSVATKAASTSDNKVMSYKSNIQAQIMN